MAPILCEDEVVQCEPARGESSSDPKGRRESDPKSKKRSAADAGIDALPCSPIKKLRDDDFTPEAPGEESKNQ